MNKTIKIENKPVFYEDWFRKSNKYISLVPLLLFKMVLTNEGINGVSSL
jgi:hypothetical protein